MVAAGRRIIETVAKPSRPKRGERASLRSIHASAVSELSAFFASNLK
jgi:hypothetical protein